MIGMKGGFGSLHSIVVRGLCCCLPERMHVLCEDVSNERHRTYEYRHVWDRASFLGHVARDLYIRTEIVIECAFDPFQSLCSPLRRHAEA
jgi:hypothetical protein